MGQKTPSINNLNSSKLSTQMQRSLFANPLCGSEVGSDGGMKGNKDSGAYKTSASNDSGASKTKASNNSGISEALKMKA
eukprot:6649424-Ditylum_brightwellii.AAC.1